MQRVELGVDRHRQLAAQLRPLGDVAVVHEQPAAVPERVAVRLLHRHAAAGRADVGEEQRRADLRAELAQVLVAPRRQGAAEQPRRVAEAVPAQPEPVGVGDVRVRAAAAALLDQRVAAARRAAPRAGSDPRSTPATGTRPLLDRRSASEPRTVSRGRGVASARGGPGSGVRERRQRLGQDLPAVDDEGLAGDVAGLVGGEEQRGVADVLDRAQPAQRDRAAIASR